MSVTGLAGDGVAAGIALYVPYRALESRSEFSANTVHGFGDSETGLLWLGNHIALLGGLDLQPREGFVGAEVTAWRGTATLQYYPRQRGGSIYQEFKVLPRFWLGFNAGYVNGASVSVTMRAELWRRR